MGSSDRTVRASIYLFPAVIDLAVGVLFFVPPVRIARMGYSFTAAAAVTAVWGMFYVCTSTILGHVVSERNSWKWMVAGCAIITVTSLLFILFPGLWMIYLFSAFIGVGSAFFFGPFQVFMKQVDGGGSRSLSFSTGMYTFSWSMGLSVGPFMASWLMGTGRRVGPMQEPTGWHWCFYASALGAVLVGVMLLAVRHWAQQDTDQAGAPVVDTRYRALPDLAWLGWIGAGAMLLVIDLLRGNFPKAGVEFALGEQMIGWVMFLVGFVQGLTALFLCRGTQWMYRGWKVGLFALSGMVGLLIFIVGSSGPVFLLGAVFVGIYTGGFYFYFVFHALTHPTRAPRYISINESIVGGFGIVVPLLGGLAADWKGFDFPCWIVLGLVAVVTVFQVVVHRRHPAGA